MPNPRALGLSQTAQVVIGEAVWSNQEATHFHYGIEEPAVRVKIAANNIPRQIIK